VAQRDKDWPGYTQWFLCPDCRGLWTPYETGVAAIKRAQLMSPMVASPATPPQQCPACNGTLEGTTHEI